MEETSEAERFAKAVNAGTEMITDTNEIENLRIAVSKGWISEKRLNEANVRLLTEMFALGLFDERTYNDPEEAAAVVSNSENQKKADEAHKKSVTVLKNSNNTLPLREEKDRKKKVYVEAFHKEKEQAATFIAEAVKSALDGELYQETTLTGMERLQTIAADIHARGGRVVMSVNVVLPWILGNVEPLADALIAGYDTFFKQQLEVMTGVSAIRRASINPASQ